MRPTSGEVPHRCAHYLRLVGIGVVSMSVRSWHQADVQPIASRDLVPAEKRTCLISVGKVRSWTPKRTFWLCLGQSGACNFCEQERRSSALRL